MPDPTRAFWLWPVTAISASVRPESARIVNARSDTLHPFQLRFFQRRHGSYCAKPTRAQPGWPCQGLAKHLVRNQAGVQESSGLVSGRTPPARYQFPSFRLGSKAFNINFSHNYLIVTDCTPSERCFITHTLIVREINVEPFPTCFRTSIRQCESSSSLVTFTI